MATSSSFWHRKVETYRKYERLPGGGQGDGRRTGVGGHRRGRGVGLGELGGRLGEWRVQCMHTFHNTTEASFSLLRLEFRLFFALCLRPSCC